VQILAGGRGKAGGIKLVNSVEEVRSFATNILNKPLVTVQTGPQGKIVRSILIEEATQISRELYVGCTLDRSKGLPLLMASAEGGVEIETLAKERPEAILKEHFDPEVGLLPFQARKVAYRIGIKELQDVLLKLSRLFIANDCQLLEVNPLVLTKDGKLVCLDAKVSIDDRAHSLHPELAAMCDISEEDPAEVQAAQNGLSYVSMTGNIGCMVNGAGLAMSTMDIIKLCGGNPANFLDVGGGASKDQIKVAFKLLTANPDVKVVFINIFGGILKCDVLAQGIVDAASEMSLKIPAIVRLEGTNVETGKKILKESGLDIIPASDMEDGARKAVQATVGR
jgi:succinyl-CoA synthetase beta subunit